MAELAKWSSTEHNEISQDNRNVQKPKSTNGGEDEAWKLVDEYDGDTMWTAMEEKKLLRKIDWRLIPVLCITYTLQYYDKAMLSQAALFGLQEDLDMTSGNRYSFSASIFYIGFIIGTYPSMMLAQKFPIERVASGIVTLWGLTLLLTVTCTSYRGLWAQRLFLGLLESGISPMFMVIVGSFYKKDEQAMRMGIWYSCTGFSSLLVLVNYGLGLIGDGSSSWRYMYYFGGGATIIWGAVLYFLLLPDPVRAKGFDSRERYIMVARLRTNNSAIRNTHLSFLQIQELFLDLKFWLLFSCSFLVMIANGPITTFFPIIISGFGFNELNSFLLSIPPGIYAGFLQLILPYIAYRFKNCRSYLIVGGMLLTTLAALLLWLLPRSATGGLLFGIIILLSTGAAYAIHMGLLVANTAGYTKRSAASSGLFIGYCLGNLVGPLVFRDQDAPSYAPGFITLVVTSLSTCILAITYRFSCMWTNRKRGQAGTLESYENVLDSDLTDKKNPTFRYVL